MKHLLISLGFILSAFATFSWAQQPPPAPPSSEQIGDYTVHYSVFNSLFIPAEIASRYNLVRANNQALINISVQRTDTGESIAARVTGTATNMLQQSRNLTFRLIEESEASYAIGSVRHTNEEVIHFKLDLILAGGEQPLTLTFTRKLHTDKP